MYVSIWVVFLFGRSCPCVFHLGLDDVSSYNKKEVIWLTIADSSVLHTKAKVNVPLFCSRCMIFIDCILRLFVVILIINLNRSQLMTTNYL